MTKTMKQAFAPRAYIQSPVLEDFYKVSHRQMYKPGVTEVLINFTGRSGRHSNVEGSKHYSFAGLQHFINAILVIEWQKFFDAPIEHAIADYKRVNEGGLGVPCDTSHLEALHKLGYLPLEFRALPEGSSVPYGVASLVCRNTHPDFAWLPNNIETILSDEIWPVQTSLTTASAYMAMVKQFAAIDGTPTFLIPFLCHDFSMRGMMGGTMAGGATISGLGPLMAGFAGSDTLPAALLAERDYGAYLGLDRPFETIASVPATEHSVQCSFGGDDLAYFEHCMSVYPTGILSLVSDGYDLWALVTEVLPKLKDKIMARDGKIVIRPDSGDPVKVICGDEESSIEHERKGLIEVLWDMFGGTETEQGYRVLDSHIGAIYGDSITLERQKEIYERLHAKKFAIANVVLGVGSYTYQYVTRDTHGSAVKATNVILNGVDTPICKEVKGDAVKKSAKGRLVVITIDGDFVQYDCRSKEEFESEHNELELVWRDGEWFRIQTLNGIRDNVSKNYKL